MESCWLADMGRVGANKLSGKTASGIGKVFESSLLSSQNAAVISPSSLLPLSLLRG